MPEATDYMKFAHECLEMAKSASAAHRPILLHMAETWRGLALDAERRRARSDGATGNGSGK